MSFIRNVFSLSYTKKEGRIDLYDFIRGFAMLLVVMQHSEILGQKYLLAFHMPLFFFLTGFVSGSRKNTEFFKWVFPRFKRLMVPYLAFGGLFIVSYYVLSLVIGTDYNIINALFGMVTGQYGFVNQFLSGIYWFLMTLFVAELLAYPFCKLADSNDSLHYFALVGGGILFIVLSYITTHGHPVTLFTIDKSFMAAAFILLGKICKPLALYLLNGVRLSYYIIIFLCSVLVYFSVIHNSQDVLMFLNQYGDYSWFFISSLSGIIASILLARIIEAILSKEGLVYKFLLWTGYNSLALFPVHVTVLIFLRLSGFYDIIGVDNFLIHFVIALGTGIPLSNFISKYLPWLLGETKKVKK